LLHPVLEAAAAEGIGVFAATGDCGASGGTEGDSTDYPSSDPYVTGIGATVLSTVSGSGSYSAESGWSGNSPGACNNGGGSGGGFSPYPRPPWQAAPGFPSNSTARGIPDVSLVGGPSQVNITMYGQEFGVGGTSAGTPMWADLELLADQDAGHRLGNLNPSLYALARIGPYGHYFHDVTSGNNGYAAGTGWDPVTGLGSPIFSTLVPALVATAAPSDGLSVQLYGAPRIGRAPLTTTFTVAVHVGTPPVQFIDVGFGDGNATLLPDPRNHTGAFTVDHTYVRAGVFAATATVVDGSDNSSTGPPIAVVVGGGQALNVSLDLSTNASSLGAGVLLTANVTGGTGPYSYSYFYGDGTYAIDSASSSSTHPYDAVGGDCAAVVVMDSASPVDGGTSARVGIAVGGASAPVCPSAAAMTAQIAATVPAADLPGDLAFQVNTTGGVPPVSVQYASDDPYVGACECGIFTTAGNHQVEAFVNDSFDEEARASTNVTLYPAWTMNSSVSATVGTAPLDVAFRVSPTGGHLTASPSVNWSFGDGTTLQGSNETPMHLYTVPGVYTATVLVEDQGGGRASAAWIINVTSSSYRGLQVGASIAPAVEMPAGSPVSFNATATGGVAPYQYRWDLGVNDSAFGANVSQSYSALGCLGLGTCPLNIGLTVKDAAGTSWTRTFQLPGAVRGRSSAVDLTDSGPIANGVTPYPVRLTASASGVLGLVVQWNFGDGNTTTGTTVSHTYYRPGNFNVVETARDPYGDALVRSHTVVVTGVAIPPLQVRASVNQTRGIAPLTVAFNASASGGTGAPYHVYWDFGDKSNLTAGVGYSVVHTYGAGGDYAGFANISDGRGDVQSVPLNLTVYDPTLTSIALNVTPPAITPADPVGISVHVTAVCMKFSVPGCSNGSVALGIRVGPSNTPFSQAAVVGGPAMPNAAGWFNETIGPFPSLSGMVWIWAASLGLNYTGRVYTAVLIEGVLGPCGNDCGTRTPLSLPPWEAFDVLMAGVTGGAAVLVGVLVWRRRSPPNDEAPAVTP
ncbi:MAG: PKD domain-containing protein, partial [Thermoplasmata archaeon]|nr:PKD domain-containing protein [Thermoplasmata archaeon]